MSIPQSLIEKTIFQGALSLMENILKNKMFQFPRKLWRNEEGFIGPLAAAAIATLCLIAGVAYYGPEAVDKYTSSLNKISNATPTNEDLNYMHDALQDGIDVTSSSIPTDAEAFFETVLYSSVQTVSTMASLRVQPPAPPSDDAQPTACRLTLTPGTATTGTWIKADLVVPRAFTSSNAIGYISCETTISEGFGMPAQNVSSNSTAFNIPMDFQGTKVTATCYVQFANGGDEVCRPSAVVEIGNPGPCATRKLPGPETIVRGELEWQRCPFYQSEQYYPEAKNYCDNLIMEGHDDWRLPTKDELKSLVYCSNFKTTPLPDYGDPVCADNLISKYPEASCCKEYTYTDEGNISDYCDYSLTANQWDTPTIVNAPGLKFNMFAQDYYLDYCSSNHLPQDDCRGDDNWTWLVDFNEGEAYIGAEECAVRCVRTVTE